MGRILVVDDSYAELQLIQSALDGLGHELVTAMDGEEGERIAKAGNINLIILDVILPKKNGFQVCRELKKDDKHKHIPIIMVTSKDQDSDQFWGFHGWRPHHSLYLGYGLGWQRRQIRLQRGGTVAIIA